MAVTMTCQNCKHWERREWSDLDSNLAICTKATMLFEASKWTSLDGVVSRTIKPEHKDTKMFVQDASDYSAYLYTRNDFFCAHWEQK